MPQSLSRIWLHIVFSTKDRRAFLHNTDLRAEMFRMLAHHAEQAKCPPALVGGWIDHVHIVCGLARTICVADLIEQLKTRTSSWAKERCRDWEFFHWQAGYGAFSVSQSYVVRVIRYVERQAIHHAKMDYQGEFRALCGKHEVELDERYAWQ